MTNRPGFLRYRIVPLLAGIALWGAASPARGQIDAWYELVDSSGPGEGVVSVQQGAAGTPLVITTDDDAGAYNFTIRFVVSVDPLDPIIAYAVDLVAPDSSIVSTSSLTFLNTFKLDDIPIFSTGPGPILEGAAQLNIFDSLSGEIELFEFEMSVSEPPIEDVAVFSEIGPLVWSTTAGGSINILFADSEPIDGAVADLISTTPSIVIRRGQGDGGPDCNDNQIPDDEEIAADPSIDCNDNGVPDECDVLDGTSPDCNDDGFPDECDVADGASRDCNDNGVPDECELADGTAADCDDNGNPDECDLAEGLGLDCNENDVPDDCDLADGVSGDCNANGTPDECDIAAGVEADCNENAFPDACDVSDGASQDANSDGIPDECAEEEGEEEEPPAGGAERPVLRRILGILFNVPADGGPTVSSLPMRLLGEWGMGMSLRLMFMEWMDLPVRMILFELAYVAMDAVLDSASP